MRRCDFKLITQKGCPACKYLEEEVLPYDDVGVDILKIETKDDFETVFSQFPDVRHVPTLVCDCGEDGIDFFTGVEAITSILMQTGDSQDNSTLEQMNGNLDSVGDGLRFPVAGGSL